MKAIKKKASPVERIEQVEQLQQQTLQVLSNQSHQVNQQLLGMAEVLDALVRHVGEDVLNVLIQEGRAARDQERADQAKQWIDQAVEAGQLQAVEVVGPGSVVVGCEFDAEGNAISPAGRLQVQVASLPTEEIRNLIIGAAVGSTISPPGGGSFRIDEIYDPIAPPPEAEVVAPQE